MKRRNLSLSLILILWLAMALRVWQLGEQSLWYDEAYGVYLGTHLSLDQALDLTVRDIVPPLYYLLLRVWLPLTGTSEFALRFLSVLFGVVAVALLARIGRHLVLLSVPQASETDARWGSFLTATLAATATVLIWLSQDARMYGPLLTWSLFATWGLLRGVSKTTVRKSRRRGWAVFVGAALAALYTHTISAFWLLGQVTVGLLVSWRQRQQRERVYEALTAMVVIAVGYLPWVIVALVSYQTNAGYWPGYLPPPHLWRTAWETFVGGQYLPANWTDLAALWFGAAALLGWVIMLFKQPRIAVYLFCYLIIPLLAMGIAFQRTPKLAPRYPTAMACALLLIVAVATVVAARTSRVARFAAVIVLLGVFLIFLRADGNLYLDPNYAKDDWRAAANYVQVHRRPDESVILISGHAFPAFAYYYGWEGWDALPDDVQLDINHVLNYPAAAPRLNQILENASGAWLVLWQNEVVDPTQLVSTLLSDVGRELPVPVFPGATAGDQVELRHFELETAAHFPEELPIQYQLERTVAPGLTALGYNLPVGPLPGDAELSLRVFWRAEEALQGAHAASLRLSDRLGQEWARGDTLLAGPYFSERWPPGTPVMGHYTVTLPSGTSPGMYTPTLMIYRDSETFETLRLPPLEITRPLKLTALSALGLSLPPRALSAGTSAEPSGLSLVGVGFDQATIAPCQNWSLSLAWRAETQPTQEYHLRLNAGSDQVETPLAADYATTQWQAGDVWRTRHRLPVGCRALDGPVRVVAQLLDAAGQPAGDPISLGEVTIVAGRDFTLPTDLSVSLDVHLSQRPEPDTGPTDVSTLMGYTLEKDRLKPGENLQVTLYWRAGQATDRNYSVFAHLESDRVWAQHDGWPVNGKKPTSTWAQGEIITDQHVVSIDRETPPGPYRLVVGMYDAVSLEPLMAFGPDGQAIEGGRIVLQSITIYDP